MEHFFRFKKKRSIAFQKMADERLGPRQVPTAPKEGMLDFPANHPQVPNPIALHSEKVG
jgi:hypothetical protein